MSDFTNILDVNIFLVDTELDTGVDFTPTGDLGQIVISTEGWGEDEWGGPWGEGTTLTLNAPPTSWTNIDEP